MTRLKVRLPRLLLQARRARLVLLTRRSLLSLRQDPQTDRAASRNQYTFRELAAKGNPPVKCPGPRPSSSATRRKKMTKMSRIVFTAGIFALTAALGASEASAQGRGGGHGGGSGGAPSFASAPGSNQGGQLRGLDRADVAAGTHGARGRALARSRGANAKAFCPPGQAKKSGQGSRFQC
jgi:hypothetical protein